MRTLVTGLVFFSVVSFMYAERAFNHRNRRASQFPAGMVNHGPVNATTCLICRPNETLSEYIWRQTTDLHATALHTDFIQGLKSGTLDPEDFGRYVLEDGVWCERVSRAIAKAAERESFQHGVYLQTYLQHEVHSYKDIAVSIYNHWRVSGDSCIELSSGGHAYEQYAMLVATSMDIGYFLTCMIPCLKLWPWLGSQIITGNNDTFGPYGSWINSNFDPTYDGYKVLDNFIDDMHANGELDENKAMDVFRNCMQGEVEFFSAAV